MNGWAVVLSANGPEEMFVAGESDFPALMAAVEAYATVDTQFVIENFFITQATAKNSQAPWSLKVIGAVEWVCLREGLSPLVLQTPSDAKNFVPDAKLRALGYRSRGGGGHHNDAARHLVLYRVNHGWRDRRAL